MTLRTAAVAALIVAAVAAPGSASAQDPDTLRTDPVVDSATADSLVADSLGGGILPADTVSILPTSYPVLPDDILVHLDHVTAAFFDTPSGLGLVSTALAEAEIAAAWTRVAGMDSTGLTRMRSSMSNVLHALDPVEVGNGAGLGYGVRRASEGVRTHVELAMQGDSIPASLAFHGPYALRAVDGTNQRLDDAIALARRVQQAQEPEAALRLINRLADAVRAVAWGHDADDDGRIGHTEAEVGIAQAAYHLSLVYRAHGLVMPDVRPDSLIEAMGLRSMGRPAQREGGR